MATRNPSEYDDRREALATYFDSTARQAWIDLTSDAKVSGIRATVRAGRDAMRANLLDWLPTDLRRTKVLDAGCGTGSLAVAAACRGAEVTGIDVAPGLIEVARDRTPSFIGHGRIHWRSGDMLDPALGTFGHVVAMDSLIHYTLPDMVWALAALTQRCTGSIVFTFAPYTPLLGAMNGLFTRIETTLARERRFGISEVLIAQLLPQNAAPPLKESPAAVAYSPVQAGAGSELAAFAMPVNLPFRQ